MELDRIRHDLGEGEDARLAHGGEVEHAEGRGDDDAGDHAKEDAAELERALGEVVEAEDHGKGDERHAPGLRGAPQRGALAAGHVLDGRRVERDADREDHRAGDDRREEALELAVEDAEENRGDAAHDLSPEKGAEGERGTHGLQRRQERERDAHDDGQVAADATERRKGLQCRVDGGEDQRDLDDVGALLGGEVKGGRDEDRRRDDAGEGRQHVLERAGQHLTDGRHPLALEQDRGGPLLPRRFRVGHARPLHDAPTLFRWYYVGSLTICLLR